MTACRLAGSCAAAPVARVSLRQLPTGQVAYLTAAPIAFADGGTPACADHLHSQVDGMLFEGLGPAEQPARERLDDPPAAPC